MDNYERSRDRAQAYFLGFDQESLIRKWHLRADAHDLFVDFLGRPYAINRKNGAVTRLWDGNAASYGEALSIFDLLCHEEKSQMLSGQLAPVNSLNGCAKGAAVGTDFYGRTATRFGKDPEKFHSACIALGGIPTQMGDLGFQFTVFQNLPVVLKFYHADEDFPASITLLWDANMLQFVLYETVFYIAGCLLEAILENMK